MQAKLSTSNPDDWFVWWRDSSGKLHIKRGGINRIKEVRSRREFGRKLCQQVNSFLAGKLSKPNCIVELRSITDSRKDVLRRRSWQSYHYAVNKFEAFLDGRVVSMDQITRQDCKNFVEWLFKQKYGGHTINGIRGFLGTLFSSYADQNEDYTNPFKGTRKAKLESGRHVAFTEKQRDKLWQSLPPDLRLFTRFIYFTYIRPIELLRLRVSDIKLDIGEVIIQGHQNKNKKQQSVVIPDAFLSEIKAMGYDEMPHSWYLFGKGLKPGPESYGRNSVTKLHRTILDEAGLPSDYTLYSWKHTGVVAAYKAGIDIYAIMRQLRHHSLEMTQIYMKSLGLVRNEQFGKMMK